VLTAVHIGEARKRTVWGRLQVGGEKQAERVCHARVKGKKGGVSGGMKIRNVDAEWVVGGEEDVRTKSTCSK
jgi:hypothetical protein